MKTILVATDFSDASRNASLYAVEMAKAFHARLILFTAYRQMSVPANESALIGASEDMGKVSQQLLELEAKAIYSEKEISLEISYKEGFTTDAILETAREMKADLIITGMKATGKGFKKVFGSVVTRLSKKTNIPMIVVPENTRYTPINTIAIANESDLPPDTDSHLLYSLRYIAERFHSKVYIVRVFNDNFRDVHEWSAHPLKLERTIRTIDPMYKRVEGNEIPASLNKFIRGYNVNLLAILPHSHNLLERIFIKSTTSSIIFESYIPLLILPTLNKKLKNKWSQKKAHTK